jgi:replicative DNA helicase
MPQLEKLRMNGKTNGRAPPKATGVEQTVLGAILLEPDVLAEVSQIICAEDFYDRKHARIYEAITDLYESGSPIDLVSVTDHLRRRDDLEDAGGAEYLTDLTSEIGTTKNAEYHSRVVAEKALLRTLIENLTEMVGRAYGPGADAFELMDEAMASLLEARQRPSGTVYTGEDLSDGVQSLLDAEEQELFVPTGFPILDDRIDGLHVGRLNIISARTNHGKSATADQIALNVAKRQKKRVLKFDLENSDSEKVVRLAANMSGVPARDIQRHAQGKDELSQAAYNDVREAAAKIRDLPLTVDTSSSVDAEYVRARLQAEQSRGEVGLVIVDDIGNMSASGADGPRDQASRSIIGLHHLAKDEDVAVLAINQINRQALSGANGYPHLHHLKWTGAAEEKTALVLMLHHDLAHWEATERAQGQRPDPHTLRVFVRKNKGPQGSVELHMDKETLRIKDPNDQAPF